MLQLIIGWLIVSSLLLSGMKLEISWQTMGFVRNSRMQKASRLKLYPKHRYTSFRGDSSLAYGRCVLLLWLLSALCRFQNMQHQTILCRIYTLEEHIFIRPAIWCCTRPYLLVHRSVRFINCCPACHGFRSYCSSWQRLRLSSYIVLPGNWMCRICKNL